MRRKCPRTNANETRNFSMIPSAGILRPRGCQCLFLLLLCLMANFKLPLLATATSATGVEDLISARCQSKCLLELEQRHKNNSETRRLLRHQISTLCKEDVQCASCIVPCRELVLDNELCAQTLCRDTREPNQCRQSCAFLEQIAANKPGQCPKPQGKSALESECSAFCDTDSDCSETEKCCAVGCSRTCLVPSLNDSRLLPRPEGITVQERKRKRSAILRWIMKRLTPQHTATNSNLFVIQWRWSVHRQSETMTPWQTVMVRNKMYAILKHLLAPGRFYLFRVAAVNVHGTYGFSQPSHPAFKLTKEVKAPSAPTNLTAMPIPDNFHGGRGAAQLSWTPPDSELPIKEYRLSWWETSPELAKAFELRQRRSSKGTVDEDYDGGAGEMAENEDESRKSFLLLPSYSTRAELSGLERGHVYMVELYATVDSSEGELRGEPAILFVGADQQQKLADGKNSGGEKAEAKTGSTADYLDFADDTNGPPEQRENLLAELKTPFYEGGRLKTIVSWLQHPNCGTQKLRKQQKPQFRVLIRSVRCSNQLPPQQFLVHNCVATLENLQFRCEYYVQVEEMAVEEAEENNGIGNSRQQQQKTKPIARLTFATLPCQQTPTDVPLQCDEQQQQPSSEMRAEAQPLEASAFPAAISSTKAPKRVVSNKTTTAVPNRTTKSARNREREVEEEQEWLPIEEVEEQQKNELPKERGTRTRSSSATDVNVEGQSSQQQRLSCFATSAVTAECSWTWPSHLEQKNNALIGFRSVLSSTLLGAPTNVTILNPEQRRSHLTGLSPKVLYRFRLQAVTAHGLGAELMEHFSTGHLTSVGSSSSRHQSTDLAVHIGGGIDHFPGVVELPWGSSASTVFRSSSHFVLCRTFFQLLISFFLAIVSAHCL